MNLRTVSSRSWVDLGFVTLLSLLALIGFKSSFGGWAFMLPAVGGLLAGLAIGALALARKWSVMTILGATLMTFLLLGGPLAVRSTTVAGFIPTLDTVRSLAVGATAGWKQLITTLPPVGDLPPLLTIPFLTGLVGGVLGIYVALRWQQAAVGLIVPFVMLTIGIAVGTRFPVSVVAQGMLFGAAALGWLAIRSSRHDAAATLAVDRTMQFRRLGLGVGVLTLAAILAMPMGSMLPMADSNPRFTLRETAEPPFDPRAFASPLGGIRKYTADLRTEAIFTVTGLPAGERLRLATMDSYDGVVWGVAGTATGESGSSGVFERVGPQIPTDSIGEEVTYTVTIEDYSDVWLPDAGKLIAVDFDGPRAEELRNSLRYNRATGTGAVPVKLREGDSYAATSIIPPVPTVDEATALPVSDAGVAEAPNIKAVKQLQDALLQTDSEKGDRTPFEQILLLTSALKEQGYYSNGDVGQNRPPSLTGHGAYRLSRFSDNDMIIGDEEQYAAAAGLLSSYSGLPTRVVVGAIRPADVDGPWTVTGDDMTAWIEVGLDGAWVPIDVVPDKNKEVPQEQPVKQRPRLSPQQVLPPPPPEAAEAVTPEEIDSRDDEQEENSDGPLLPPFLVRLLTYVALPLALIAGTIGAMAGAKALRRRQRRTRGDPATRIAGGWREAQGVALDQGALLPDRGTRRETAAAMPATTATLLADRTDEAVFGPTEPDDEAAADVWSMVREVRTESNQGLSPWQRVKAIMSLRSWRAR